jgi:hypothetical protein
MLTNLDFAMLENHQYYSFDGFRPPDHGRDHRACLPVAFAFYLIQIRWIWTHF